MRVHGCVCVRVCMPAFHFHVKKHTHAHAWTRRRCTWQRATCVSACWQGAATTANTTHAQKEHTSASAAAASAAANTKVSNRGWERRAKAVTKKHKYTAQELKWGETHTQAHTDTDTDKHRRGRRDAHRVLVRVRARCVRPGASPSLPHTKPGACPLRVAGTAATGCELRVRGGGGPHRRTHALSLGCAARTRKHRRTPTTTPSRGVVVGVRRRRECQHCSRQTPAPSPGRASTLTHLRHRYLLLPRLRRLAWWDTPPPPFPLPLRSLSPTLVQ